MVCLSTGEYQVQGLALSPELIGQDSLQTSRDGEKLLLHNAWLLFLFLCLFFLSGSRLFFQQAVHVPKPFPFLSLSERRTSDVDTGRAFPVHNSCFLWLAVCCVFSLSLSVCVGGPLPTVCGILFLWVCFIPNSVNSRVKNSSLQNTRQAGHKGVNEGREADKLEQKVNK